MDLALACSISRARVGSGLLRQHDLRVLEEGRTMMLAMALGPPRLWSYLLDGALDGFTDGFYRPHDGRMSTRLHQGLRVGQQALRTRVDALIERRVPDVGLIALSLDESVLHVLCAGPLRAFLHRRKTTRRLSAREECADGMLKVAPNWCAEQVEAGDLVFVGSLSACQEETLQKLRTELDSGRALSPQQVAETLSAPATEHELSAIAVSFRVPSFLTGGA